MFRPQYAECILLSELHYTTIFYTAFVIADSLNLRVVCPQRTALSNLPMELAWRKKSVYDFDPPHTHPANSEH